MGDPVLFLHGWPGGPGDAAIAGGAGWQVPDLAADGPDPEGAARAALARMGPDPVHVIGFSLGAMLALKLAAAEPERVTRLTLISAAGPLQLGDFLGDMAGAPVFRAARAGRAPLWLVIRAQAALLRVAPGRLLALVFAGCPPEEAALVREPDTRATVLAGLRAALIAAPAAYSAVLRAYVRDWRPVLEGVACPVTLWHGTRDGWAPPAMAEALAGALPGPVTVHRVPGGSHYTTLRAAEI